MKFSIFKGEDHKLKSERHRVIHWVWKSKIFLPLIWYLERHIKKFMVSKLKDIPDEPYNKNFRILYNAMEKGTKDWYFNFYGGYLNGKKNPQRFPQLKENWKKRDGYHWYKVPKFFINLLCTIILDDTAYRDLVNCMMMRLQGEMNKAFEGLL